MVAPTPTTAELVTLVRELADRVQRLEASAPAAKLLRVSTKRTSQMLGVSTRTIRTYIARGLLVKLPRRPGAARNTVVFFHPDNVAALAQSEDAAREWVARRKYVNLSKR